MRHTDGHGSSSLSVFFFILYRRSLYILYYLAVRGLRSLSHYRLEWDCLTEQLTVFWILQWMGAFTLYLPSSLFICNHSFSNCHTTSATTILIMVTIIFVPLLASIVIQVGAVELRWEKWGKPDGRTRCKKPTMMNWEAREYVLNYSLLEPMR